MTSGSGGKRAGSRRAAPPTRGRRGQAALLAVGVTLTILAWGYLVLAAIDFGVSARGGETIAWLFLLIAALGAIACLFAALMLASRVMRILSLAPSAESKPAARPPGGRRAAR